MADEPTQPTEPAPAQGTPPQAPAPLPPDPGKERSLGEMLFDVSERVTLLIREEFALAKAELTEKLTTLGRGAGVGIAAGVFLLAALLMLLFAFAYLINDLLGIEGSIWVGFAIEALIWIIVAGIAGLVAKKLLGKVETPTPDMAIEELKETKETLGKTP
jgi:Putative Actinobacterial Holin-X, holin superfamily III